MGNHLSQLGDPVEPTSTFNEFIIGDCNRVAVEAATSFAEDINPEFRQLYIQSGIGLGKSFLLKAIFNKVKMDKPQERLFYVGVEALCNKIVDAIRLNKLRYLFRQFANAKIFLIDDLQGLANKIQTQKVISDLYDQLMNKGCKIIFASTLLPNDLTGFDDGLVSRLNQGLIVSLGNPDFETKLEILRSKVHSLGVELPEDLLVSIAQRDYDCIRELEGRLITEIAKKLT